MLDKGAVLPDSFIQYLAAVIYELSNLEIVTIKSELAVGYRPFDRRILEAFTINLKVILWLDRRRFIPSADDYIAFLLSHPNLVAIQSPQQAGARPLKAPDHTTSIVPNVVHTCILNHLGYSDWGIPGAMPSLKRVTIRSRGRRDYPQNLNGVLVPYRNTLTTIIFNITNYITCDMPRADAQQLYESCPYLTRVEIVFATWNFTTSSSLWIQRLPVSIDEVGVRVCACDAQDEFTIMQFLIWLTLISRGKTPEAATVQFLDDHNTDQVVIHCKAVVQRAEGIITSWKLRSGELFDLMSIENLEAAAGKAKERVEVKEYL
jgi:hypothetical protein